MKLSVIKHLEEEKVTYNPGVFKNNEDLIIFPFKEFDAFYNGTVQSLNVVKKLIDESLNPESTTDPIMDLDHILDWIKLVQDDLDLLIKFNIQTTLKSFKNIPKIENPNRANELVIVKKDKIQCLIGL